MGRVWLIVVMSLWIATLGNLALWRELGNLPELQGPKGLSFKIAFGVGIAGVAAALLALFNWRHVFKPVLTILLVATALGVYFMLTYGVVLDPGMMTNVLQTDWRETRDLLNLRLLMAVGAIAVVPLLWIIPHALRTHPWKSQLWRNLLILIAGLGLAVAALMTHYQEFASVMRNHTKLRYLINPLNSFYAIATLGNQPIQRNGAAVLPIGQDAHLTPLPAGAKPPLVLLVVGETARADHQGLNGYARDTTPELAARGVVSLRNAWSCGTNTAASVPCMFSPLGREAFNARPDNTEGLADVLQRAGYAVLWLDNQAGGCKGVCDRVPTVDDRALQTPGLCDAEGECLDEVMLNGLDERIAQLPPERRARGVVVFMHQMGSHGPAYYKRSPKAFKKFEPECTTNALQQCSREQVVNAYDNTIVYTDHVLASNIDWLKAHEAQWSPALMYLSDHGESLGENNLYLHGLPYRFAPDVQKHIPWMFWLSPQFQQESGISLKCLAKLRDEPVSQDNYFHTVLGLLGVRTTVYDPRRDMGVMCQAAG